MKKLMGVLILCLSLLMQGCFAAAAGSVGYIDAQAKYGKLYDTYKLERETINAEMVKNGSQPAPIKNFHDWLIEQPLKHNEIKVFKSFGVITPEEAKEVRKGAVKREIPE